MASTFDKVMGTASRVASSAAKATGSLVNKGYDAATKMSLQAKLGKLHRQLGALVYALAKNGEDNQPMVNWYIAEIDKIKAQLAGSPAPTEDPITVKTPPETGTEGDEDAMFCGRDGDNLP